MEWFRKHVDAVVILSAFGASVLWMNGKFNDLERDIYGVDKDLAVIKTVLIMGKIMPGELAKNVGE